MASISASVAVGEVLRQPDDLLKLAAYRKKLLKEKGTLDAKLASGVKAQLDATRDALLNLQASRAAVALIREEMMAVEKLKGSDAVEGDAFDKITRVSTTDWYHMVLAKEELTGIDCASKFCSNYQDGEQSSINERQSGSYLLSPCF